MDDLERAIEGVVHACLGIRPGENVVVVVDEGTRSIGDRLRAAAGSEAVLVVMAALSHTRARKAANENGARGATLPGVTEDLLARCMAADLATLKTRSAALVEDGRLTHGEPLKSTLLQAGELGTNLAELGIGTNERARLTGSILEDEKILGTVHVAFGASAGIGGTVSVPVHIDSVITDPTLTIGDTLVIEGGRFLL
jgi:leucyl aminopeptidase (aminopeptidase T)